MESPDRPIRSQAPSSAVDYQFLIPARCEGGAGRPAVLPRKVHPDAPNYWLLSPFQSPTPPLPAGRYELRYLGLDQHMLAYTPDFTKAIDKGGDIPIAVVTDDPEKARAAAWELDNLRRDAAAPAARLLAEEGATVLPQAAQARSSGLVPLVFSPALFLLLAPLGWVGVQGDCLSPLNRGAPTPIGRVALPWR